MTINSETRLTRLVKRALDVIWLAVLIATIAWPIVTIVVGLNIPENAAERHTDVNLYSGFRVSAVDRVGPEANGTAPGPMIMRGQGEVYYNNTRGNLAWYLSALIPTLTGLLFLFGLFQLRKVFAHLLEGAWYAAENVGRIRKLGWIIIAWQVLQPLLQYFAGRAALADMQFNSSGIELYPAFELNILGLITGLAVVVLAGVIREATQVHQEQALTI